MIIRKVSGPAKCWILITDFITSFLVFAKKANSKDTVKKELEICKEHSRKWRLCFPFKMSKILICVIHS